MNLQPGFVPMFRPVAVPYVSVAMPIHPGMAHPPPPPPGQAHYFPGPPPAPPPSQSPQSASALGMPAGLLPMGTTQTGLQPGSVNLVTSPGMQSMQSMHASQNRLMSIGLLGQAPQMSQAALQSSLQSSLQSQGLLAGISPGAASINPGTTLGQLAGQYQQQQQQLLGFHEEAQRNKMNSIMSGQIEMDLELPQEDNPQDSGMAVLDYFNSDLNLILDEDGYGAKAMTSPPGFCFCWAGARSTYGVCKGKVYFEVHISEYLEVNFGTDHQETNPHVVRVGWSVDGASMQLGEEQYSYGYGGTGKLSVNSKFSNYGEKFMAGDVIGTLLDLDSHPPSISYTKNGQWLGVAVPLHNFPVGEQKMALFPHILSKNCGFKVNFGQMAPWYPPPQGYMYIDQIPFSCKVHGMEPPEEKSSCEMIMIIGLPGAGKTTWGSNMQKSHPEKRYNIVGTDTLIDKMRVMGLPRRNNYNGRWDVLIDKAGKCLNTLFQRASKRNRNYILDQTNVYPNAQKRKMKYFQGFYRKAAILVPDDKELVRRSNKRTKEDGKFVPEQAILEMKKNFQLPDPNSSSFDEINFVELPREVAVEYIRQYNQEGRGKVPNRGESFDRFRPNQGSSQQYGHGGGQSAQQYQSWPPPPPPPPSRDSLNQPPPPLPPGSMMAEWQQRGQIKRETDNYHVDDRKRQRADQGSASALDFIKQEYAEDDPHPDGSGMAHGWQGLKPKGDNKPWDQFSAAQTNANMFQQRFQQNRFDNAEYKADNKSFGTLPSGGAQTQQPPPPPPPQQQRFDSNMGSYNQGDNFPPNPPLPPSDAWRGSQDSRQERKDDGPPQRRQDSDDRDNRRRDNNRRDRDDGRRQDRDSGYDNNRRDNSSGYGNRGRESDSGFGNRGRDRDSSLDNSGRDRDRGGSNRGRDGDRGFGNRERDNENTGNRGRDNDRSGNRGRDNDRFGNRGRDNDNFGNRGRDNENFGNRGRDNENFGNRGRDSESLGNRSRDTDNRRSTNESSFNDRVGNNNFGSNERDSNTSFGNRGGERDGFGNRDTGNDSNRNRDIDNRGNVNSGGNYDQRPSNDMTRFGGNNFNMNQNIANKSFQSGNWNDNMNNSGNQSEKKIPPLLPGLGQNLSENYSQSSSMNVSNQYDSAKDGSQRFPGGNLDSSQSKPTQPSDRRHFSSEESNTPPATGRTRQRKSKWDVPSVSDSPEPPADSAESTESTGTLPLSLLTQPPPPPPEEQEDTGNNWGSQQNWPPKPPPQPLLQMDLPNTGNKFQQFGGPGSQGGDAGNLGPPEPQNNSNWGPPQDSDFGGNEDFPEMNNPGQGGPMRMRGSGRGFGMPRGGPGPRFQNRPPGTPPRFGPPRGGGPGNFGPRSQSPFGESRGGWNGPPPRGPRGFEGREGGPRNFVPRFGGPRMGGPRMGGPRMGGPRFQRMPGQQRWLRP